MVDGGVGGSSAGEVLKTKAQAIRLALKPSTRKVGRTVPDIHDIVIRS